MARKIKLKAGMWRKMLFTLRRDEQNKDVPWLDWYTGRLMGTALVWLARRALARGDVHEFNHCAAVIAVGNTDGNHDGCPLDLDHAISPSSVDVVLAEDRAAMS